VTKIGSNHGVRSDLFKRPLDKTRITDFFGGVAQVEVVNPADSIAFTLVSESVPTEEAVQGPRQRVSLPPPTSHATEAMSSFSTLLQEWRIARAWASVGLIGVLVGWVLSKR